MQTFGVLRYDGHRLVSERVFEMPSIDKLKSILKEEVRVEWKDWNPQVTISYDNTLLGQTDVLFTAKGKKGKRLLFNQFKYIIIPE